MGVREVCKVMDYPYIEQKWKDVVEKTKSEDSYDDSTPKKKADMIRKAMGAYARQMKLVAYRNKRYVDSDEMVTLIQDAETIAREKEKKEYEEELETIRKANKNSLSVEERAFLMRKWDTEDLNDIMYLEEYYLDTMEDFEIVTRAHKDYLIMIATVSLKLKKALKSNDLDSLKVLRPMFSAWMKEADFTAQQNNKDKTDFASCFGEIAAFLEEKGFIDTITLEFDRDMVDKTIGNLNSYTRDLVLSENGLGDLLESTIKLMNAPDEDEDSDYEYGDENIWEDDLDIIWGEEDKLVEKEQEKEKEEKKSSKNKSDKDE